MWRWMPFITKLWNQSLTFSLQTLTCTHLNNWKLRTRNFRYLGGRLFKRSSAQTSHGSLRSSEILELWRTISISSRCCQCFRLMDGRRSLLLLSIWLHLRTLSSILESACFRCTKRDLSIVTISLRTMKSSRRRQLRWSQRMWLCSG